MNDILLRLRAALKEPSTIAGLGMLLALVGIHVPNEVVALAASVVGGALGIYEVYRTEAVAPVTPPAVEPLVDLNSIVELTREVQDLRARIAAKP